MNKIILVLIVLFLSGCTGLNNSSDINPKDKVLLQAVKNWNVVYDSTNGYNKPAGNLVDNEEPFTHYKDVNSVPDRPSPEYMLSDLRGKRLSTNIIKLVSEKGMKLTEGAEGKIVISRPTFLNEGRYILRTFIVFYGKGDKEIAVMEVTNNLRKETTAKGIRYADNGDLLNDIQFADVCAEKINDALSKAN